jgi:hypothetical protein
VNIIRVPHNPRPAACHLSGHAPTPPAPRPARSLRAQSFLALPSQQHDSKDNAVLERLSEVLMGSTCAE